MLKAISKLLPFLLLILFSANSCRKGNDQKSKMQLITERDWKIIEFRDRLNNGIWDDFLAGEPPCTLDDRYVFRTNNSYEWNEGPTKCNVSDPQIIDTGTWALIDNETKVAIDGQNFMIEELTNNKFALVFTTTLGPDTYTLRWVFAH